MKTAALEGALLVFHPGSGNTVALTGEVLAVFQLLQMGANPAEQLSADGWTEELLDNCLRLLRQQQLIVPERP